MADQETVRARRADVEQVMLAGEWTLRIQEALARKYGVTPRMIRHDAVWIRKQWTKDISEQEEKDHRARLLAESRALRAHARRDGQLMVAARLLGLESRLTGTDSPTRVEVTHRREQLSPLQQAHLIVEHYDQAKALIDNAVPGAIEAIEAEYSEVIDNE